MDLLEPKSGRGHNCCAAWEVEPMVNRARIVLGVVVVLCAGVVYAAPLAGSAAVGGASPTSTWGRVRALIGLRPNNPWGFVGFNALSCPAAGSCVGVGSYPTSGGPTPHSEGFLDQEVKGVWARVTPVPGLAALSDDPTVSSASCATPGNCSIGGGAFVADESRGVWGAAHGISGLVSLYPEGPAISCGAPGNCAAIGVGATGSVIANEVDGSWGPAVSIPGLGTLSGAQLQSVSCRAAGDCAAGGSYIDSSGFTQAFVLSESDGTWGTPKPLIIDDVPSRNASTLSVSVSCGSVGSCAAGGFYTNKLGVGALFAVSETAGTWGKVESIRGFAAIDSANNANDITVSCAGVGVCVEAGQANRSFVVDEVDDVWGVARLLPGLAALSRGSRSNLQSVSCGAKGYCAAVGYYQANLGTGAFVADESNGVWHRAQGILPSRAGGLDPDSVLYLGLVSCWGPSACTAAGYDGTPSGATTGLVASEPSSPPHFCTPQEGLSARVLDVHTSSSHVEYQIGYANTSIYGCVLSGVPGAIALNAGGRAVGPPARRVAARGSLLTYLDPIVGSAHTTFSIDLKDLTSSACDPAEIDGVIVRAMGLPQIVVPLDRPKGMDRRVCQRLRSERMTSFAG